MTIFIILLFSMLFCSENSLFDEWGGYSVSTSDNLDAFSLNPITGDNSQFIIQARWGLSLRNSPGASIYICSKEESKIIDSHENIPDTYYTNDPQSGVTALRTLESEFKQIPLISEREVNLLSKIIGDIESRVGFPVHIEWGIEKRKFKLENLQAGLYEIWGFESLHEDNPGIYFSGTWDPYKRAARFALYTDTVDVRARWDVEGVIIDFE